MKSKYAKSAKEIIKQGGKCGDISCSDCPANPEDYEQEYCNDVMQVRHLTDKQSLGLVAEWMEDWLKGE